MVEKCIRQGICHSICWYAKANSKYMNDYNRNKESRYLQYWDVNNLYGWAMSQKLSIKNFKCVKGICKFDESFIKSYNEESNKGYFLEVNVQYPENLHNLHSDLFFMSEIMIIEKREKHVVNLYDKTEYVIHIGNLKQALNHGLVLKQMHRISKFKQKAWLKSYIDMKTVLRKETKSDFEKYF